MTDRKADITGAIILIVSGAFWAFAALLSPSVPLGIAVIGTALIVLAVAIIAGGTS